MITSTTSGKVGLVTVGGPVGVTVPPVRLGPLVCKAPLKIKTGGVALSDTFTFAVVARFAKAGWSTDTFTCTEYFIPVATRAPLTKHESNSTLP